MKTLLALLLASLSITTFAQSEGPPRLGSVEFANCELPGKRGPVVSARCATLEVPEDGARSEGRRIALALAWLPTRRVGGPSASTPDAVLFLAGGPGQSARESYVSVMPALEGLRRNRHVLLVDQRGTGGSNRLACPLADWRDPSQATATDAREQAIACRDALSPRADLSRYTTRDAIADFERVREQLGIQKWNLVGGSYGTRVALEYLRRHPDSVRSVVIDSVVPPELALLQDHARNLDDALARQFALCAQAPGCAQRLGDPRTALDRLLQSPPRKLAFSDPREHTPRQEMFGPDVARLVTRLFSYAPESAGLLPLLLHEAATGRPEALMAQADLVLRDLPAQLAHGMELSVTCSEDEPFLRPDPEDAGRVLGAAAAELLRAQCAVWPRGTAPSDLKQPVVSAHPVLVLSGELDPVTPPRYGDAVARHLSRSRHLVARGQGHIVMTRGCMPRLVRRFIDELDPAALDARCLDDLGYTPPFETWLGPAP